MARKQTAKTREAKTVKSVKAAKAAKPARTTSAASTRKPAPKKRAAAHPAKRASTAKTTKKTVRTSKSAASGKQPLSHIRVLDLSRVLAGPWATQNLADLGAEVIKVERPGSGDDTRSWGPPFLKDAQGQPTKEAAYFLGINRSKRSVTIDISKPEGQALIRHLAAESDVVIENYKVGTLARYGLDYKSLRKINPRIIYCSITGFGQDGPYCERPAYDFLIQGMSGLMSITGERADRPGGGPMKVGIPIADLMTGLYGAIAILGALTHRDRTGVGQHIDLALLDVQIAVMTGRNLGYFATGQVPQANGNEHPNIVPQTVFPCRDGHLIIVVGNDSQFSKLCKVMGCPDMAADPRFATNPQRVVNREELNATVIRHLMQKDQAHWIAALEAGGIPCGPINNIAQVFNDPQVRHRGMQVHMPHPLAGSVPLVANPIKYSATPITYRSAPPLLGEHTDSILRDSLGLQASEIAKLRQLKII